MKLLQLLSSAASVVDVCAVGVGGGGVVAAVS